MNLGEDSVSESPVIMEIEHLGDWEDGVIGDAYGDDGLVCRGHGDDKDDAEEECLHD